MATELEQAKQLIAQGAGPEGSLGTSAVAQAAAAPAGVGDLATQQVALTPPKPDEVPEARAERVSGFAKLFASQEFSTFALQAGVQLLGGAPPGVDQGQFISNALLSGGEAVGRQTAAAEATRATGVEEEFRGRELSAVEERNRLTGEATTSTAATAAARIASVSETATLDRSAKLQGIKDKIAGDARVASTNLNDSILQTYLEARFAEFGELSGRELTPEIEAKIAADARQFVLNIAPFLDTTGKFIASPTTMTATIRGILQGSGTPEAKSLALEELGTYVAAGDGDMVVFRSILAVETDRAEVGNIESVPAAQPTGAPPVPAIDTSQTPPTPEPALEPLGSTAGVVTPGSVVGEGEAGSVEELAARTAAQTEGAASIARTTELRQELQTAKAQITTAGKSPLDAALSLLGGLARWREILADPDQTRAAAEIFTDTAGFIFPLIQQMLDAEDQAALGSPSPSPSPVGGPVL